MILYFKNSLGEMRKIAKIDGRMSRNKIVSKISQTISDFCKERNFTIYYTRIWDIDVKGKKMTQFDVGSHTEFFFTYPTSYELFTKVDSID